MTFEALAESVTRFTLHSIFDSPEVLRYVIENYHADAGGMQTTDRLGEYVESLTI